MKKIILLWFFCFLGTGVKVEAKNNIIESNSFESASGWETLGDVTNSTAESVVVSTPFKGRALEVNFGGGSYYSLRKSYLSIPTNVVVRVYFYDDMRTEMGQMLIIRQDVDQGGMGIGVNTNVSMNFYTARMDGPATMKPTRVARTKGWHMAEVVVTDKGSFIKIDNVAIDIDPTNTDRGAFTLAKNSAIRGTGIVELTTSWSKIGTYYWDEFMVVGADGGSWQDQFDSRWSDFSDAYAKVDFSGMAVTDDYVRQMSASGLYYYMLGKSKGDRVLMDKGVSIITKVADDFGDVSTWWVRGGGLLNLRGRVI